MVRPDNRPGSAEHWMATRSPRDDHLPHLRTYVTEKDPMNVANLQLEGLLMAVAEIKNALVHKVILSVEDIDIALKTAKAAFTGDQRLFEDMSPASRDAACLPGVPPFSALAQAGRDHQAALQRPDVKGA